VNRHFGSLLSLAFIIISCFSPLFLCTVAEENPCSFGGWLEERDGIRILHINGSNYEMGYQHGILLKNEVIVNYNAFIHWANQKGFSYDDLLTSWVIMQPYIPTRYIEEMQGLADATSLSFQKIALLNVGPYFVINCGSFAAWGSATLDGKLYHARSHDMSITIQDPDTGSYLVENQLLIVRKPDGSFKSIAPSTAGDVACSDGINEMGIVPGMLSSWTNDETFQGIGVGFRVRIVLDTAATLSEATQILTENKTLGYNFIVSDGKIPEAYAIETTATLFYVSSWNTSSESRSPFWEIPYVVRRANLFVNPNTSATQRNVYNTGLFPLFSFFLQTNKLSGTSRSAAGPYLHYVALSKGLEKQWGKLDLSTAMTVLRDVYQGKTDFRFFVLQKLHCYSTPYQWVLCPETGDFIISFATHTVNAFESDVHFFNLFELLNANTP
jgi:hypothetical protein